jgi:4-hydroxy-tetrahydrodipicolinate synthase
VLFYKYLLVLNGDTEYTLHFNETDELSASQRHFVEQQYAQFKGWWAQWDGTDY